MKKLSLQAFTFESGEVLTKNQLREVLGGFDDSGSDWGGGTCGTNTYDTHGRRVDSTRGMTKEQAQNAAAAANAAHAQYCTPGCLYTTKWCCDSCD